MAVVRVQILMLRAVLMKIFPIVNLQDAEFLEILIFKILKISNFFFLLSNKYLIS